MILLGTDLPVFYDLKDLQEILHIGHTKANKLANTKGFPAIKLEGKWLISKEKFEQWYTQVMNTKTKSFSVSMLTTFENEKGMTAEERMAFLKILAEPEEDYE